MPIGSPIFRPDSRNVAEASKDSYSRTKVTGTGTSTSKEIYARWVSKMGSLDNGYYVYLCAPGFRQDTEGENLAY